MKVTAKISDVGLEEKQLKPKKSVELTKFQDESLE